MRIGALVTSPPSSSPPKLPVWSTVDACYATVARNFGQLLRISWLQLLIITMPPNATSSGSRRATPRQSLDRGARAGHLACEASSV